MGWVGSAAPSGATGSGLGCGGTAGRRQDGAGSRHRLLQPQSEKRNISPRRRGRARRSGQRRQRTACPGGLADSQPRSQWCWVSAGPALKAWMSACAAASAPKRGGVRPAEHARERRQWLRWGAPRPELDRVSTGSWSWAQVRWTPG